MSNFRSLARLEVPEKFVWWVVGGGVCKVIFMSNPTVVLCCVGVGVLTTLSKNIMFLYRNEHTDLTNKRS